MANKKIFDLEERTAKFGEDIIEFAKKIPQNPIRLGRRRLKCNEGGPVTA